jgi:hypothetical protein
MRPRYAWELTAHIDDVAPATLPPWVLTLVTAPARRMQVGDGRGRLLREGERNDGLFRIASALRRHGLVEKALRAAVEAINRLQCVPPLEPGEVAKIAASATRYAPAARCEWCGAPLLQETEHTATALDEEALMARALGVV